MRTEKICAVLKKKNKSCPNTIYYFSFNTQTQSNVENAMMDMHYSSSEYYLCYQSDIDKKNSLFRNKESRIFYHGTDVKLKKAGKRAGDLKWVATSLSIKMVFDDVV